MEITRLLLCLAAILVKSTFATDNPNAYCPGPSSEDSCCGRFGINEYNRPEVTITASSSATTHGVNHGPDRAALFEQYVAGQGTGGWASGAGDQNQWIQVDFVYPRRVTGVLLQGRGDCCDQWVTSYRLSFSDDLETFYSTPTIEGTYDRQTVTRRYLDRPFVARYVRLNPIAWHGHITLRFDLLGCEAQ